jgi:hypothetical protein
VGLVVVEVVVGVLEEVVEVEVVVVVNNRRLYMLVRRSRGIQEDKGLDYVLRRDLCGEILPRRRQSRRRESQTVACNPWLSDSVFTIRST